MELFYGQPNKEVTPPTSPQKNFSYLIDCTPDASRWRGLYAQGVRSNKTTEEEEEEDLLKFTVNALIRRNGLVFCDSRPLLGLSSSTPAARRRCLLGRARLPVDAPTRLVSVRHRVSSDVSLSSPASLRSHHADANPTLRLSLLSPFPVLLCLLFPFLLSLQRKHFLPLDPVSPQGECRMPIFLLLPSLSLSHRAPLHCHTPCPCSGGALSSRSLCHKLRFLIIPIMSVCLSLKVPLDFHSALFLRHITTSLKRKHLLFLPHALSGRERKVEIFELEQKEVAEREMFRPSFLPSLNWTAMNFCSEFFEYLCRLSLSALWISQRLQNTVGFCSSKCYFQRSTIVHAVKVRSRKISMNISRLLNIPIWAQEVAP